MTPRVFFSGSRRIRRRSGFKRLGYRASRGGWRTSSIKGRATRELATANEELRRTIDAIPHAITVLGPDGSTLGADAFVLDYTGLTLEEVRPTRSRPAFPSDDVARLQEERRKALLRGGPFEAEQRSRRKDGQYRWFLIRYNPVRDDDGTTAGST